MVNNLEAKVRATNLANLFANELYDVMAAVFGPFVGQKITKADGSLLAKVQACVPDIPHGADGEYNIRYWFDHNSKYSLRYGVSADVYHAGGSEYSRDQSVYIGNMDCQVLVELSTPEHRRVDWTVEELRAMQEEYRKVKKQADNLCNTLMQFGLNY